MVSPKLFSVYVDDLSDKLVERKVGCSIDNLCMNHVMYADDICLMAPSPAALQELFYVMILVFEKIYLLIHPNHIVWYLTLFLRGWGLYDPTFGKMKMQTQLCVYFICCIV